MYILSHGAKTVLKLFCQ